MTTTTATSTSTSTPLAALLRVARVARATLDADDARDALHALLGLRGDPEPLADVAADLLGLGAAPEDIAALVDGVPLRGGGVALRSLWLRDDVEGIPLQLEGEPADRQALAALVESAAEDAADEVVGALDDVTSTQVYWVEVTCWVASAHGEAEAVRGEASRTIHPPAPDPCGEDHEWSSPHSVVRGCRENPGVWGLGGTRLQVDEVCTRCGTISRTQTDTCPHGHTRRSYTAYSELDEGHQVSVAREALGRVEAYVLAEDVGPREAAEALLAGDLLTEVLYLLAEDEEDDEEGADD